MQIFDIAQKIYKKLTTPTKTRAHISLAAMEKNSEQSFEKT